jgi:hypothetical protein
MLIKDILLATTLIILSIVEASKLGSEIGGLIKKEPTLPSQLGKPTMPSLNPEESTEAGPEAQPSAQSIEWSSIQSIFETFRGGNDGLRRVCVGHLTSLGVAEVVKAIKKEHGKETEKQIIHMVLMSDDPKFINDVRNRVNPSDSLLVDAICSTAALVVYPKNSFLLSKESLVSIFKGGLFKVAWKHLSGMIKLTALIHFSLHLEAKHLLIQTW